MEKIMDIGIFCFIIEVYSVFFGWKMQEDCASVIKVRSAKKFYSLLGL